VLLGEPPRTQADLNFSLLGIPVRVHPFFWLMALLLGFRAGDAPAVIIWIVAVFVGVLFHEMGHAVTMRAYGYYPWITLYGLGGLASYDQRYGSRGGALQQILISLAGPGAGFLLAGLLLLGVVLAGHREGVWFSGPGNIFPLVDLPNPTVQLLIRQLLFVCIAWGILNLLPIYPLDGGQVAREIFVYLNPREGIRLSLQMSILFAGMVAVYWLFTFKTIFVPLLFGYLAYSSYQTLRFYSPPGRW